MKFVKVFTQVFALTIFASSCTTQPPASQRLQGKGVFVPDVLNDPVEPLNRGVWAFNHGLLKGVIMPASRGYRFVVPAPARNSIKNFGYNLGYPGRAINQLLQGRVGDAGNESVRFVTNTTVGLLGLFDVASEWDISKPSGTFAQTFHAWGWTGKNFIVLPLFGPSDEVSAAGTLTDRLADPLTYSDEGRLVLYGTTFNNLTADAENTLRILKSDSDSYDTARSFWTFAAKQEAPKWSISSPRHLPSLETLAVTTLKLRDSNFPKKMKESRVKVSTTGKQLAFNYRLQEKCAPLVYVMPGLGSHRLAMQSLYIAEGLYDRGYSVVTISGNFQPEFIENASSAKVPGYAAADRKDLKVILSDIDKLLETRYSDKLGCRAMVGSSMGGFHALSMASESMDQTDGIEIKYFLAINPPVDLFYALKQLDAYQESPAKWPESVRQSRINNSVHKAVALINKPESVDLDALPLDGIESKYLVGMAFRLTLRNAIYASQRHHKLGNLRHPLSWWSRQKVYDEILSMSFADYLNQIVSPHFSAEGVNEGTLRRESDLKRFALNIGSCSHAHVITSSNDFLMSADDLAWLRRSFGPSRLTVLERGGHLGSLANPQMHDLIDSKLKHLK